LLLRVRIPPAPRIVRLGRPPCRGTAQESCCTLDTAKIRDIPGRLAVKLAVKFDPKWSFGGRFEYVAS
jgi:hypothetical protein